MSKKNLIPPPNKNHKRKYDFTSLRKYGDVVYIETTSFHAVRDAAHKYAKFHGFKVATRKYGNGLNIYHAGEDDWKSVGKLAEKIIDTVIEDGSNELS